MQSIERLLRFVFSVQSSVCMWAPLAAFPTWCFVFPFPTLAALLRFFSPKPNLLSSFYSHNKIKVDQVRRKNLEREGILHALSFHLHLPYVCNHSLDGYAIEISLPTMPKDKPPPPNEVGVEDNHPGVLEGVNYFATALRPSLWWMRRHYYRHDAIVFRLVQTLDVSSSSGILVVWGVLFCCNMFSQML